MKFCVLASGSKGNSTYIETNKNKILVDIGTTSLYITNKLKEINITGEEITGIFITHLHSDHINGLKVFLKKYHTKLYLTQNLFDELIKQIPIDNYEIISNNYKLNDLSIDIMKSSHDVDGNIFVFESNKKQLAYITDTGYINIKNHNKLINKNAYIIESNHDVEMLLNGKYQYHLKQRILSDYGHLSNEDCANYLEKFIGKNTKKIVLIHLSEENNCEEKAETALNNMLSSNKNNIDEIYISKQNERTELVEV